MNVKVSSNRRLLHESMESIRRSTAKFVTPSEYLVLTLRVMKYPGQEAIADFTDDILLAYDDRSPAASFSHGQDILVVFSTCEKHLYDGNLFLIVSDVASKAAIALEQEINVEPIILKSRSHMLTYILDFTRGTAGGYITDFLDVPRKKVMDLTRQEVVQKFAERGVDYESIPETERYGEFKKLRPNDTGIFVDVYSSRIDTDAFGPLQKFLFAD